MCRMHVNAVLLFQFMNQPPEKSVTSGAMVGSKKGSNYVCVWKAISATKIPRDTVPESERKEFLAEAHELGRNMSNAASNPQRVNTECKRYHPMTAIHAQLPGDHMAVDLIGKLPITSNGIFVLIDISDLFS
ncbi:hypothetical protein EDD21DRAFT_357809 [Dissophora ornata]|nr:hypothetical protein EDD21DRAFT_357809 [Dissophora ornata]